MSAAEGKFFSNEFVGNVMPCSKQEGYESAVEADMAAYQARSFLQVSGVVGVFYEILYVEGHV